MHDKRGGALNDDLKPTVKGSKEAQISLSTADLDWYHLMEGKTARMLLSLNAGASPFLH